MILNFCKQKLELEYPCNWLYKVIGPDQDLLRKAIAEVVQERECTITFSNSSSSGKYTCLNVEMSVHSEEDRSNNHQALKNHPDVTMVL